jgi:hypothetical protein
MWYQCFLQAIHRAENRWKLGYDWLLWAGKYEVCLLSLWSACECSSLSYHSPLWCKSNSLRSAVTSMPLLALSFPISKYGKYGWIDDWKDLWLEWVMDSSGWIVVCYRRVDGWIECGNDWAHITRWSLFYNGVEFIHQNIRLARKIDSTWQVNLFQEN